MIEAIYLFMIVLYILLVVSVVVQSYTLGVISGMGLIICGIYFLSDLAEINNFLTMTMGTVNIGVGAFVFIQGSLDQIEQA